MNFFSFIYDNLKKMNLYFLILILILQAFGLTALYSATHGAYVENNSLFYQQMIWIAIGWLVFFIIANLNDELLKYFILPAYWFHIVVLVLTLFIGKEIFTARRWIDVGFFNYQPSETLKLILVLVVAKQLSIRTFKKPLYWKDLFTYGFLILVPVGLVLIQPDLGTAGVILMMLSVLILFNGIKKNLLISLLLLSFISIPVAWNFVFKPYQKSRIMTFINPDKDPKGSGYNIIQSKVAIGSGKIFGKGLGKGTQNKLQFLPERHTDFIFSVLSEELGLLGSGATLLLFFALVSYIFRLASICRDRFTCYLCLGAGSFFLCHGTLNMAMTMGLFPVVGAPLPLFSYGGSHLITCMSFLGFVAYAHKRKGIF